MYCFTQFCVIFKLCVSFCLSQLLWDWEFYSKPPQAVSAQMVHTFHPESPQVTVPWTRNGDGLIVGPQHQLLSLQKSSLLFSSLLCTSVDIASPICPAVSGSQSFPLASQSSLSPLGYNGKYEVIGVTEQLLYSSKPIFFCISFYFVFSLCGLTLGKYYHQK